MPFSIQNKNKVFLILMLSLSLFLFSTTSVEGKRRLLRPQTKEELEDAFLADTLQPHFVSETDNLFNVDVDTNTVPESDPATTTTTTATAAAAANGADEPESMTLGKTQDIALSESPSSSMNFYKINTANPSLPKGETLEEQDVRIQSYVEEKGRASCGDRYMSTTEKGKKTENETKKSGKALKVPRIEVKNVPKGAKPFSLSSISYGTLHSGSDIPNGQAMLEIVKTALNLGITTFDMADVYGWYTDGNGKSNDLMGEALKLQPSIRKNMEFICKFGIRLNGGYHVDTSPDWIRSMVDTYLTTFNTDYIDVLMIHNPPSYLNAWDIASTYKELYDEGKVKYFGLSNFWPNDFDKLEEAMQANDLTLSVLETMFSTSRPQKWNDGTVPTMLNKNSPIPVLAWGAIGGDPMNGPNPLFVNPGWKEQQLVSHLTEFGQSNLNGLAPDQVMMTWLTSMTNVVAILGTTKVDRLISQAMPTVCGVEMSDEEWNGLLEYSSNLGIPPPF